MNETSTKIPPDEANERGVPATVFFAAIVGVLLIIVVLAIFVGRYRTGQQRQRWRGPNSPSLVYSVTMHGSNGASFLNTIEGFLRESRRGISVVHDSPDCEQRDITDKSITGLPSYEESISSYPDCPPIVAPKNDEPPPPPYSESYQRT